MPPDDKASAVVYITEERILDFGPATMYGKLHMMDLGRIMPYASPEVGGHNDQLIFRIRQELINYIPGVDYICPVGSPPIMAAVGMVLADKGGMHNLLGWDNHTKRYLEYRVRL